MALVTEAKDADTTAAAAGDGANAKQRSTKFDVFNDDEDEQAYWIYWCACFVTVITWMFAVTAATDRAWISLGGRYEVQLGGDCSFKDAICRRYTAASAFQIMATIVISLALIVVAIAAFTPPPFTSRLGLAFGTMLAVFSLFQMAAFSFMAAAIAEFEEGNTIAGPTLGVAVMAWLFGLAGTITILFLRLRVTMEHEGPFRKYMPGKGGNAGGGRAEHSVGTV